MIVDDKLFFFDRDWFRSVFVWFEVSLFKIGLKIFLNIDGKGIFWINWL